MIKAIILDFGSVIYKTDWKKVNKFFYNKNGFNILVAEANDGESVRIYKDSDLGKEDFRNFFLRINPDILDIDKIIRDYKEGYSKFKILNKNLLRIVKDLGKKEIILFGFSDVKKEHYEANLESGLYNGFTKIFTSYKFKNLKSEKEAFEKLISELNKYNLNPSERIFVDDHLPNIENAKKFGFKTIHYTEFPLVKSFKKKLKKFLKTNEAPNRGRTAELG